MIQLIRPPAVAGSFYPTAPQELQATIRDLMSDKKCQCTAQPRAMIVPHAGYGVSGTVAATAYAQLVPFADAIDRVMIVGSSHHVGLRGLALAEAQGFETPLGRVPVDRHAVDLLLEYSQVGVSARAHQAEHSVEVQLPFLQYVLTNGFSLTPLVAGEADANSVAEVMDLFWRDPRALIVVSSDLSHAHDYPTACRTDRQTTQWIERLQVDRLKVEHACGYSAIRGLLQCAQDSGARLISLDVRNSGDTAGARDEIVGYGAYVAA